MMAKAAEIPIIDVSRADGPDQPQIARALVDAAVDYGFVYVKHTGLNLTPEQVSNAFELSRILFSSPLQDKHRCSIEKNNQGWSGMHTETLDPKTQRIGDFKEGFNFGPFDYATGLAMQPVPQSIEPYQASLAQFRADCHTLCRRLLLLFGVGLSVTPEDFFAAAHPPDEQKYPSGSILRLLYYPHFSAAEGGEEAAAENPLPTDVRAGAHSDYGSMTLLFRLPGQAGLEIIDPRTGSWTAVPVVPPGASSSEPPPILVNIGDLLSYWTNGLLRSTVHRVTFPPSSSSPTPCSSISRGGSDEKGEDRYSIVYFCHPADDTPLSPVPSERVRQFQGVGGQEKQQHHQGGNGVLTAKEHLQSRLRATYLQMYEKDQDKGA